jgi:hypothetical protein
MSYQDSKVRSSEFGAPSSNSNSEHKAQSDHKAQREELSLGLSGDTRSGDQGECKQKYSYTIVLYIVESGTIQRTATTTSTTAVKRVECRILVV